MKEINKKGFTLIELLVVVLIIGILAAIAVPQYQYAVLKAKYNNLKPITTSLYRASQAYMLANGKFPSSINDIDISVPKNAVCTLSSSSDKYVGCIMQNNNNNAIGYIISNNTIYCVAYDNSANSHKLCNEETNNGRASNTSIWYYYPSRI